MKRRLKTSGALRLRFAFAMRQVWREGYNAARFRADLTAGIVVGIIALPLSMALAIASGVPPQHGLYTAVIAGAVIALLGGSRVQVAGPTAAFVVILAPISAQFGIAGLLIAPMIAGVLLIGMGLCRLGRLIEFIPYSVTCGFTAGIAVVIATIQIKDLLGLTLAHAPESYIERISELFGALPTMHWPDMIIGVGTLVLLLVWPKVTHRIPAPLVGLTAAAVIAFVWHRIDPSFDVATINSRFSFIGSDGVTHAGIPRNLPMPMLPWHAPGPGGEPLVLSFNVIESLGHYGVAIAMLGAIESLLSAVVADGMTGYKHDPDAELFAQGIGNFIVPWFGGIAATGAIARTAASIRTGANSPVAAIVHAGFVLAAMLLFAPLLGHLPMAAMAALLIVVAKNMSEAKHFANMLRVGPRGDVAVLLLCFALTVLFDMVIAVSVGVVMAALLFMQRMAAVSGTRLADEHPFGLDKPLPEGVILYEIAGPLFFGAAQKATSALTTIADATTVVVLDLRSVPVMDATGLVNLESAVERLLRGGTYVILAGVQRQPKRLMARAGLGRRRHELAICSTFERGIRLARAAAELTAKNAAAHR